MKTTNHPESTAEVKILRKQIRKLKDENVGLLHWAATHHAWAAGHCGERMKDFELYREDLRKILRIRKYKPGSWTNMIKRQSGEFWRQWRNVHPIDGKRMKFPKRKPLKPKA